MFCKFVISMVLGCSLWVNQGIAADQRDFSDTLVTLLTDENTSLTEAKLRIDALIDPEMDEVSTKAQIRRLAFEALQLAGNNPSDGEKVLALKKLIYKPGLWNMMSPFDYDFDNPQGRQAKHKTLAYYLESRKGNCVSMPILFLAIAEEMGVEMNITTAPPARIYPVRGP